jgi:ubiquinone/menaquinone biosynthesis C-methylase UbiE
MGDEARQKQQIAGVFDRAAPTYDRTGVEFFGAVAADLVAAAGLVPGQRVVDVGCGRGASLFLAAEAVGPTGHVVGVDLAPGMVAATAAEAQARGLRNVTVRLGDAADPGEPDEAVDVVIAGLVLFFLPDAAGAVREWHAELAPGGRLALSTFTEDTEADRTLAGVLSRALAGLVPDDPPASDPPPESPRTRFRTRESITGLLTGAGFTGLRFTERTYRLRFTDPAHFWRWLWSTGARAALERVPADRLPAAQAAVGDVAEAVLRDDEGELALHMAVRLTTATAG